MYDFARGSSRLVSSRLSYIITTISCAIQIGIPPGSWIPVYSNKLQVMVKNPGHITFTFNPWGKFQVIPPTGVGVLTR